MSKVDFIKRESERSESEEALAAYLEKEAPMPNKRRDGNVFSQAEIDAVWRKAVYLSGSGATEHRKDKCGSIIQYDKFGDTSTSLGWEIDHINPISNGGTDDMTNLQALRWENNRRKGDKYPWTVWDC